MSMYNFLILINTNTGAILIRISTRKPSDMFSKKKTKTIPTAGDAGAQVIVKTRKNVGTCFCSAFYRFHNLCVTSAPGCQVSWRARPPRCRRESKVSTPSTHTFAPKEKSYDFSRCGLQTIIFCNKEKLRCAAYAEFASIGVARNQRHCHHSFFRRQLQQSYQWWKQDAAWQ